MQYSRRGNLSESIPESERKTAAAKGGGGGVRGGSYTSLRFIQGGEGDETCG